ncbi:hypothetical protein FRZ67_22135 [Panacibacter ginsenosidivorans]|uniref:DUF5777 domain-containing protein n=1 Tax=Panacibacter ginsenosidivorans TaxID=1813871 RepID=A0A5B8VEF8_9BACT|nr:DUF5777 family beta-barrel protein [Panacibacter ginsenosidivorans]QEC69864.1 hypothetical protein FRZ67_22135 [Panacibacter ginsenosidivorans]
MKLKINKQGYRLTFKLCLASLIFLSCLKLNAQDSTATSEASAAPVKIKPVKNTFQSIWIIDNQTVMVPVKKTLEFDFQHRMGLVNNGSKDLWGLFGSANIRLGVNYSPINKLYVGIGIAKYNMLLDLNAKYSIITQTKNKYAVSVSWYGNAAVDTRKEATLNNGEDIKHNSDRYTFFNQLLIARKISDKLSLQVAPSWSHQNAVWGYYTSYDTATKQYGNTYKTMNNEHFAIAVSGRYKFSNLCSVIFNYDQPLTIHNENNPNPNISLGLEVNTSSHAFQIFIGNYNQLNPQHNNMYNQNNPLGEYTDANKKVHKGYQYLIGFNITRLWNY